MDHRSERSGSLHRTCPAKGLFLLLPLCAALAANAEISGYEFRRSYGTYVPITGGTELVSGSSWNNELFTVSLPSPFWFNGQTYAQMYGACNGYITFGSAPSAVNFAPLSSTDTYAGALSPFGTNLWHGGTPTSGVRWQQVGREVVVQWKDARRLTSGNIERFSFQCRLNLDNGVIKFVYGPALDVSLNQTRFPQVGMRGPDNVFPVNVNNRFVDGTVWWGNSMAGTDNQSTCRFTSKAPARWPAQGLTFTYAWAAGLELELTTDNPGSQTSWEVRREGQTTPACSGSGYGGATTYLLPCLLTPGQFRLSVMDSAGDGICCANGTGGYVLRNLLGDRVIDNGDDGVFTVTSSVAAPFDLPLGKDHLVDSLCGRENVFTEDHVQAAPDADVRAEFGQGNQTNDGYQFWFFDPDGGYTRRIFISHATNNYMFPAGPDRCSFLKIGNITTNRLPLNKLLNVKVRSRVNGVDRPWGPACRLRVDLPDLCPSVKLLDSPDHPWHSCGITGVLLNGSRFLHAELIPSATKYKFEFSRAGYLRNVTSNSSSLLLTVWGSAPLQYGNKTYNVRVSTSYDDGATWCPFGPACTITTAAAHPGQQRSLEDMSTDEGTMRVWPNPLREGPLTIRATFTDATATLAEISVLDATGRTVSYTRVPLADGEMNTTLDLREQLEAGAYVVIARSNGEELIRRVVLE